MILPHIYRIGPLLTAALWLLLTGMFATSCSLDDERDVCCGKNTIRFRYLYRGNDRFDTYIHQIHYLLFDSVGHYVKDMQPVEGMMSRVRIGSLPEGGYTLVGIGNLKEYGELRGHTEGGLEQFHLAVTKYIDSASETIAEGDRIYWGECPFTVVSGADNSYLGELSNVHCVLRVRVEWELIPEFRDGYTYQLAGIGRKMKLTKDDALSIGNQFFPQVKDYSGVKAKEVPLRRSALDATMVTLRWTDQEIPRFQLRNKRQSITKEIALKPIFERWGWHPDSTPVQEYEICLKIQADGSIMVKEGVDVGVGDWIDGGALG
ncbi:secreted protein containing DUF1812 [gut metagenome]|uniref:Secreted protein containing DUF1812 n=1 Tax=gut metagenome TaxID=749906 RepID=J9G7P8_9ZZZZ